MKFLKYIGIALFIFSGSLGFIGTLFKIMHWPWANVMLMIGFGAPAIGYVIFSFLILIKMIKSDFENKNLWIIGLICCPFIVGTLYLVFQNKILKTTIEE